MKCACRYPQRSEESTGSLEPVYRQNHLMLAWEVNSVPSEEQQVLFSYLSFRNRVFVFLGCSGTPFANQASLKSRDPPTFAS